MDNLNQSDILASLADTLERLIASRVGVVEAAQQVSSVRHRLRQDNNPLFLSFLAIDSETDRFPVGPAREHWAPDALLRYDQEREVVEQRLKPFALQSAVELLAWVRENAL